MSSQLPLGLQLNDSATFANFVAASPSVVLQSVHATAQGDEEGEGFLYLWGGQGSGKTHLLQAACHLAAEQGRSVFYLPLSQQEIFSVEVADGLEAMDLVCIDDLQAIAGNPGWEQAIFHLYNRVRDAGKRMVVAANFIVDACHRSAHRRRVISSRYRNPGLDSPHPSRGAGNGSHHLVRRRWLRRIWLARLCSRSNAERSKCGRCQPGARFFLGPLASAAFLHRRHNSG